MINTKTSAPFLKKPPLPSTSSTWSWVAPLHSSALEEQVMSLKFQEIINLPPSLITMCILSTNTLRRKDKKLLSAKWQGAIEGDWEHPNSIASHQ